MAMDEQHVILPVFPLPNTVLFPNGTLALHIFESRYLDMIDDVRRMDAPLIAMALFRDGWEQDYRNTLKIFDVFGVGTLTNYNKLPDGTCNIVLAGVCRAARIEWLEGKPYRTASVKLLYDTEPTDADIIAKERGTLLKRVTILSRAAINIQGNLRLKELIHRHTGRLGALADVIADVFIRRGRDRQAILNETDPLNRIRVLRANLSKSFHQILGRIDPMELASPTDYSLN